MTTQFDTFKTRAEAVSAEVHRYATRSEAIGFILDLLRTEHVDASPRSGAVWADGPFFNGLDRDSLTRQVPGLTFNVTRESAEAAKIGIGQAEWAISDTGTLLMDATPVAQRLVSGLPTIHIAVVPTDGIQPDMPAALGRLNPATSGNILMITGPSRTADIERVLTIGVHGPSRLVVVFVDDLETNPETNR